MARRDVPAPPRDSTPDLPDELTDVHSLSLGARLTGVRVSGLSGDVDASFGDLLEIEWAAPALTTLALTGATMADARWTDSRLASLIAREGRWRNVEVTGGRIGTIDCSRAELDGVVFRNVRIDYLGLAAARVGHVRFVGCHFTTIDLPDAQLNRVVFEDCRADDVDTRGMRASDLDLRGLEALSYSDPRALVGATLSERQAEHLGPSLAAALGIRIVG